MKRYTLSEIHRALHTGNDLEMPDGDVVDEKDYDALAAAGEQVANCNKRLAAELAAAREHFDAVYSRNVYIEASLFISKARVQALEARIVDAETAIRAKTGDDSEYWLRWMPVTASETTGATIDSLTDSLLNVISGNRQDAKTMGAFLTHAIDHLRNGGKIATCESALADGTAVRLSLERVAASEPRAEGS